MFRRSDHSQPFGGGTDGDTRFRRETGLDSRDDASPITRNVQRIADLVDRPDERVPVRLSRLDFDESTVPRISEVQKVDPNLVLVTIEEQPRLLASIQMPLHHLGDDEILEYRAQMRIRQKFATAPDAKQLAEQSGVMEIQFGRPGQKESAES